MASLTSPIQTCVLRVGIKCCRGCQTNAKRKLLSVNGVSGVEYDAEAGLLTVRGDVNPAMLLHKLTKWGKAAEIVSVLGDTSRTPEMEDKKPKSKSKGCFLLRCFGKARSKAKVEPLGLGLGQSRAENNGSSRPFLNDVAPPRAAYPPPQGIPGFPTPIPYPPPYFGARPPHTAHVFRSTPPPYFQFPDVVNSRLRYP